MSDVVWWVSFACMWTITTAVTVMYRRDRRRLDTFMDKWKLDAADERLAQWCRHMTLTVETVSGTVVEIPLVDLERSEHPNLRTWNVPRQVILWSDLEETLPPIPQATKDTLYG